MSDKKYTTDCEITLTGNEDYWEQDSEFVTKQVAMMEEFNLNVKIKYTITIIASND
jgi:hypothetical protein